MRVLGGGMPGTHEPGATGMDRDFGPSRQLQDRPRIALGQSERQVAGDRDEA